MLQNASVLLLVKALTIDAKIHSYNEKNYQSEKQNWTVKLEYKPNVEMENLIDWVIYIYIQGIHGYPRIKATRFCD